MCRSCFLKVPHSCCRMFNVAGLDNFFFIVEILKLIQPRSVVVNKAFVVLNFYSVPLGELPPPPPRACFGGDA